jgi:hypothetical protein
MMQRLMMIGIGMTMIGIVISILTTRWQNGWFFQYRSTNKFLSVLSVIFIMIGMILMIMVAYVNGQLG